MSMNISDLFVKTFFSHLMDIFFFFIILFQFCVSAEFLLKFSLKFQNAFALTINSPIGWTRRTVKGM